MQRGESVIKSFVEAATKEANVWIKYGSAIPVPHDEAKRILADSRLRRRVMKARAAYRDKRCGIPPLAAKCRVVLLVKKQ